MMLQSRTTDAAGRPSEVLIKASCASPTSLGKTLALSFTVHNNSSISLPAQRLQLETGKEMYWQPCSTEVPCVASGGCVNFSLDLKCTFRTEPKYAPKAAEVTLDVSRVTATLQLDFSVFTSKLCKAAPLGQPGAAGAERFNVLLFGMAGSGKSSFINSVFTLMDSGVGHCLTPSIHILACCMLNSTNCLQAATRSVPERRLAIPRVRPA